MGFNVEQKFAYYNEIDPKAAEWIRQLISLKVVAPGFVDGRSITEVSADDLRSFRQIHLFAGIAGWSLALRQAGWDDDRAIFSGSAPCQPFSAAGKQQGFADNRHLWGEMFRLIRELRPGCVVGEQVSSKIALTWWDSVASDLESADYATAAFDLSGGSAGAPHIRSRLFWVAHANGNKHIEKPRSNDQADSLPSIGGETIRSWMSSGAVGASSAVDDSHSQRFQEQRFTESDAKELLNSQLPSDFSSVDDTDRSVSAVGVDRVGSQGNCAIGGIVLNTAADHDSSSISVPTPIPTFWDECEWVECRDGKFRPTGVGINPLAGVPNLDRDYVRRELERCAQRLFSGWDDADRGEKAQEFAKLILETRNVGAIKSSISKVDDELPSNLVPSRDPSALDLDNTQIARIMRLKGYGNSIAVSVATEFLRSVMETIDTL